MGNLCAKSESPQVIDIPNQSTRTGLKPEGLCDINNAEKDGAEFETFKANNTKAAVRKTSLLMIQIRRVQMEMMPKMQQNLKRKE